MTRWFALSFGLVIALAAAYALLTVGPQPVQQAVSAAAPAPARPEAVHAPIDRASRKRLVELLGELEEPEGKAQ